MKNLLIVSFILLWGCQENFSDLVSYKTVTGEVLDESTLEPIKEARITTSPVTDLVFSDDLGNFLLDSLSADIYSIRVSAEGYSTKLTNFNLNDNRDLNLVILLERDTMEVIENLFPTIPFDPLPSNNSEGAELNVELSWKSSDDADSLIYEIWFFRPEEIEPIIYTNAPDDTTYLAENLQFNTTYFWQVKVTDKAGQSVLGPTWNFRTKSFPTEDFRYAFIRKVDEYDQIFIGSQGGEVVQVTASQGDHWRPTFSPQGNKIAYLSLVEGKIQVHTMDKNGDNKIQISNSRPLRTKEILDSPFAWSDDGQRLMYMDFDKVVSINTDGAGLQEFNFVPEGEVITSLDFSSFEGGRIVVTTEELSSLNSNLYLYEIDSSKTSRLLDSINGQISHAQFSPSGRQIVYAFNDAQEFSTTNIPLNKRLFYMDLRDSISVEVSLGKAGGTADFNPRFANNGDFLVFNNQFSDGSGESVTLISDLQDIVQNQESQRDTLFRNSIMIDWE